MRWNGVEATTAGVFVFDPCPSVDDDQRSRFKRLGRHQQRTLRVNAQGTVAFAERDRDSVAVTALFEDREGNLWAGTSQGIERLRDSVFVSYSTAEGIPAENNGPIYVDGENRIWFGPASGGLYWLKDGLVERVNNAGLNSDVIYSITGDKAGLWIGRQKGGLTHLSYKDGAYTTENTPRRKDSLKTVSTRSIGIATALCGPEL